MPSVTPVGQLATLPPHIYTKFFRHIPQHSVRMLGVHGDGSCFFHSLAAALNYDNYLEQPLDARQAIGQRFRCDFKAHMTRGTWDSVFTASPHNESSSFHTVKTNICTSQVWADEAMIKFCSTHMQLNILFIDAASNKFYCPVSGHFDKQPTLVMLWVDRIHFQPVVFVTKTCDSHYHVRGKLDAEHGDDEWVRGIQTNFTSQCL